MPRILELSADQLMLHCTLGDAHVAMQLSGGGLVPLSHAICCRLCLPDELPPTEAPIAEDDKPVGIMSMGCHASSGTGPFSLQCEPRGNSVVTGALYAFSSACARHYNTLSLQRKGQSRLPFACVSHSMSAIPVPAHQASTLRPLHRLG